MKSYKTCVKTKSALNLSNRENSSKKVHCYLSIFCSIITMITNKNVCYLEEILQDATDLQFCLFFKEIFSLRTFQAYLNCQWYCAEQLVFKEFFSFMEADTVNYLFSSSAHKYIACPSI